MRRWSRPALVDLAPIADYVHHGGFFVEAGANDGFRQSNTYYFERFCGWRGILIEPVPDLARECQRTRPRAKVFNCALVGAGAPEMEVTVRARDLLSYVERPGQPRPEGEIWGWEEPELTVRVPARTLSSVLDEAGAPEIDFLSLDVEGMELDVLAGLDLTRHAPRLMLIEVWGFDERRVALEATLGARYELDRVLSVHDVLYRRTDVVAPAPGPSR